MNVRELLTTLARCCHDDEVKIPVVPLQPSIGRLSAVSVEKCFPGFDWDRGNVFIQPDTTLVVDANESVVERKHARATSETLAYIGLAIARKDMSAEEKVRLVNYHYGRYLKRVTGDSDVV